MGPVRHTLILLCCLLLLPALPARAERLLRVCQYHGANYAYRIELANLILARTADRYGTARIAPGDEHPDPSQDRCLALLREGQVDLAYVPPNAERLGTLNMLPVDMHAGMLGYRVLIIRRDRQADFAQVQDVEGLRRHIGGFGSQWSDFPIFERNHLPVLGMANPGNLLPMLEQRRFDYFHRALSEAWVEVQGHPDLMVEPHLALRYAMPVYFAFNRGDAELARRFAEGFEQVREDGSFRALFLRHYGHLGDLARLGERRIIELDSGLPATDASLWLDPPTADGKDGTP